MRYLFMIRYNKTKGSRRSCEKILATFLCSQDEFRQAVRKDAKSTDPKKRHDKGKMDVFKCKGRLTVKLGGGGLGFADIVVSHNMEHVPYCSVSLPDDVRQLIEASVNGTMTQVSAHVHNKRPHPDVFYADLEGYHQTLSKTKILA